MWLGAVDGSGFGANGSYLSCGHELLCRATLRNSVCVTPGAVLLCTEVLLRGKATEPTACNTRVQCGASGMGPLLPTSLEESRGEVSKGPKA